METGTRNHFLANVCHVCKVKDTPYTCEICKMIFYCSTEHRREDWYDHSRICWAINRIRQSNKHLLESSKGKDFTEFRNQIATRCVSLLGRGMEPWEFEMIYHPRICNVCREYDWEKLTRCKDCEYVFTCEKNHFRKDHSKWCKTMKIYSELIIQSESSKVKNKIKIPEIQMELNVGGCKTMVEVFSKNMDAKDEHDKNGLQLDIKKALVSELLTYPLTVLHSVEVVGIAGRPKLTILFIGAEIQAEIEPMEKWETYLMHYLPKVKILKLIFLGPELRANGRRHFENFCETCKEQKKEIRVELAGGKFYHDYVDESVKPDLICALNSGMYRDFGFQAQDSWKDTIIKLFKTGDVPVLITEYTSHEIKKDLEKIKKFGAKIRVIINASANPFASLKPGLNIISEMETPAIFKNYYYAILTEGSNWNYEYSLGDNRK